MLIGLQIPNFTLPGGPEQLGATIARISRDADEAGFHSIWVMDHFFQIEFIGPAEMDMLEGYATLAFIAAHTKRAKLGTMVTGITYRNPGVLIKTVTTLDVLSGGRAWLGIGAAWNEREHKGLGVHFPHVSDRFERLEEHLKIARQMWSDDNGPYDGKHYHLAETLCVPQPLHKPHPPILIGGMGEKKTLRLVAKYADACNLFEFMGMDELKRKLDVLKEHCANEKRPYADIEKTTLGATHLSEEGGEGKVTPSQLLEKLHALADLGIDHAIYSFQNVADPKLFELLATKVIPEANRIQPRTSVS